MGLSVPAATGIFVEEKVGELDWAGQQQAWWKAAHELEQPETELFSSVSQASRAILRQVLNKPPSSALKSQSAFKEVLYESHELPRVKSFHLQNMDGRIDGECEGFTDGVAVVGAKDGALDKVGLRVGTCVKAGQQHF